MFVNDNGHIKLAKPFRRNMSIATAKKRSIAKWEFILAEKKAGNIIWHDGTFDTCSFCIKFNNVGDFTCSNCPVQKKAGGHGCGNTPYMNCIEGFNVKDIQAEIDFLKSLRIRRVLFRRNDG